MDIAGLQRLTARSWPGLEQERLGEWELRSGAGFTGRANSALPVGDPGVPLPEALDAVRRWYATRGLVPRLQVPEPTDERPNPAAGVDLLCDADEWTSEPWTLVMTLAGPGMTAVTSPAASTSLLLDWADAPDGDWLSCYHHRDDPGPDAARRVITASPADYLTARLDGVTIGIGRLSVIDGWMVLAAIEVVPSHRGHGHGRAITAAMLARGAGEGADQAALQVFADNAAAVGLYGSFGITVHHRYRYRVLGRSTPTRC
jgi:ribosomal protein S18 acetylase RimI-like enzyme